MSTENKISVFNSIIYTILLFLYIYQFNLEVIGLPAQIHSSRIGAIGIILLAVFTKGVKYKNIYQKVEFTKYLWLLFFLLFYSFLLLVFLGEGIGGVHVFYQLLNNLLFTIPVILALNVLFNSIDSFLKVLVYVGIIQSIFIIICLVNEPFQLFLDYTFNDVESETHSVLDLRWGYAGGLGCITSQGVIKFTTGVFATSYLYAKTMKNKYFILFVVFAVLNAMISRTGFLMDIFCFLYILLQMLKWRKFIRYISLLLLIGGIIFLILDTGNYDVFLEERFYRFNDFEEKGFGESFFNPYFGGEMPKLRDNFIIGTGIVSGVAADGTIVHIDGGFFRTYSSLGLVLAIVVYCLLFSIMIKNIKLQREKKDRDFMILILLYFLMAEFKEATIFIVYPITVYFTISLLLYKKNYNNSKSTLSAIYGVKEDNRTKFMH